MSFLLTLLAVGGVTVELPTEARVRGTQLTLGDVATVTAPASDASDDTSQTTSGDAIRALSLGYAPAPGYSRLVWAHQLESKLAQLFPGLEIDVIGEEACRVWPMTERIPAERIRSAAEAELLRRIGQKDVSHGLRRPIADVIVPTGAKGQAVVEPRARHDELRHGVTNVPVHVLVDGEVYRTVWTTWETEFWDTVSVLKRRVAPGDRIEPFMLEERRVQRDPRGIGAPLGKETLVGAVATRELAPLESVSVHDVRRPIVIKPGDVVFVQVRKGSISARAVAISKDSGAIGDRVTVVRDDADDVLLTGIVRRHDLIDVDLELSPANRIQR